ncbi:diguanylate cyclase [Paucibacter sp. JuS9]|uniref:sensor domain-containing diguanylate cyclase n=1 Tax=Roseateles TaxID=93681 RepID=UPI002FE5D7AB
MPFHVDLASWRKRLNSSLGRITIAVGLLLVLVALNVQLLLRLEYQADVEQIHTDAERSAQKLAAHTSAVLDRASQSLALLTRLHEATGTGRPLPQAAELLGTEGLEAWLVADANGLVIESGGKVPASVKSTAFFRRAGKLEPGAVDLGETEVLSGAGKQPLLPLTRRLNGPSGEFLGCVTALIALPQLISPEVRHEASGTALSLLGRDGRIRARFLEDKFSHGELVDLVKMRERLATSREQLEPLASRLDGQRRFIATADLPRYPAVALVGLRAESVLANYQRHRQRVLLTALVVTALLLGAAVLLFMQSRRLEASRHRLRAAEARLRATLDGSLDAVLVMRAQHDARGQLTDLLVIDANARATALLNVREPIGQQFSALLPAARESGILQEFELAMASGQTMVSERLGHSPHLVDRWLQHQIVPLDDGVALFSRDISERYHTERAQAEQRRFLQNLLDVLPLAVYAKSTRPATMGRYMFWNRAAERCFGMTAEQVVGHTGQELFDPADAARFDAQVALVLAERRPRRFSDQLAVSSGGRQYLDILKVPVMGDDGQVDHLLVVAEDVTEKRGSAERLRLGSRVLAETADAVLICDAQDQIIDCNPAFGHLTGHHIGALVGRPVSAAGLPLFDGGPDGDAVRWVGESRLVCSDGRVLDIWLSVNRIHDGEGQLTHHARVFSDISALKRHQAELDEMARLDSLTGLPNRRSFDERLPEALARAGRSKHLLALLFIDLDGFKKVNDTMGHAAGDQLLCAVAERLKACVRTVDAVFRLGGDEFTVIVEDAGSQADVGRLCERILEFLSQPHLLAAGRPVVTPSVGVALATPGEAPDSLLRRADDAMYAAKRAGKARYCVARPLD